MSAGKRYYVNATRFISGRYWDRLMRDLTNGFLWLPHSIQPSLISVDLAGDHLKTRN